MKEKLFEEYDLNPNYLIYKKGCILFEYSNNNYAIYKTNLTNNELNELSKIVEYLDNYAIFFHQIILNKRGYTFEFGQDRYVLLRLRITSERLVTISEILKLSNIRINNEGKSNIAFKIDFLEEYVANYERLELKGINYFIGLSENSIQLFNLINNDRKYVNHKRIKFQETVFNFYNPLNIVIDYKTRDLAEYVKSLFVTGNNQLIEFLKYIDQDDYVSYFARLLFPSFYFDLIDDYIKNQAKLDEKRISNLANSYEQSLKKLYVLLSSLIRIPSISWLSNVNNF